MSILDKVNEVSSKVGGFGDEVADKTGGFMDDIRGVTDFLGFTEPSKTSIDVLKSRTTNYARLNRFYITFPAPKILSQFYGVNHIETICVLAHSAVLPAKRIGTFDHRNKGPLRQQANDIIYQPVPVTFYVDDEMKVRRFFQDWLGTVTTNGEMSFNYPEEYSVPVQITQIDQAGNVMYTVELEDAFPINMGEIQLSADANDQLMIQNVIFSYHKWKEIDQNSMSDSTIGGLINALSGAYGMVTNTLDVVSQGTKSISNVVNMIS